MLPLDNLFYSMWGYSSVVEHSTADREGPGSKPGPPSVLAFLLLATRSNKTEGLSRDLNPGPPAPKAGIIPLDH